MEVGFIDAQYWKRGRSILSLGWEGRVYAYKCNNCGSLNSILKNNEGSIGHD
jgi:hypothetical protein